MQADPRIAALEALFVIADLGTGRHRLTVPEIASGGWGGPDDGPIGTRERVSLVKAALVGAILRVVDEASPGGAPCEECGGKGRWQGELGPAECWRCHGSGREGGPVREPGAVLAGIVRAEEHERAALVRERDAALREGALVRSTAVRLAADLDEARATAAKAIERQDQIAAQFQTERDAARAEAANLRKAVALLQDAPGKVERLTERVALLEATLADYEREARARSPEGRRAAQLALFAPPAADPAGEAQRAAASGAAVSALVGAAADAPAPEAKPRRTVTCSTCSDTGHNARGCPKRYAVGGES